MPAVSNKLGITKGTARANMANTTLTLPLQNEGSKVLRLVLEPLCETFLVQPGQKVEIHGVFGEGTNNGFFTIAPNDGFLVIYAPGEIAGFVDHYVTLEGARLKPEPEDSTSREA